MKKYRKVRLFFLFAALGLLVFTACGKKKEKDAQSEADAEVWVSLDENSPKTEYDPYPLLQEIYAEKSEEGWEQAPPGAYGFSDALADSSKRWGYAILDLDKDDTDEFVIGYKEDGRVWLVNVFTQDEDGALTTQFCSDGSQLLCITKKGEWIISERESDQPEEVPEADEGNGKGEEAGEEEEKPKKIKWKNIKLTEFK